VNPHPTDLLALLFGLAFAAGGAAFLVHETTGRAVNAGWVIGLGLIVLGLVALVATLARGRRDVTTADGSAAGRDERVEG
jgi:hypothetical protein